MKIAIVGSGISGLVASYLLSQQHDVHVFEANDYVGGHTHTVSVRLNDRSYDIDTGFIVYNELNYPNFTKLLRQLGVASQPSNMCLSVRSDKTGLEYGGTTPNTLFAQRRNLLRPSFYRMLYGITRFNKKAQALLRDEDNRMTLGGYLEEGGYSRDLIEHYVIPMGAAIWSADPEKMREFPARSFVQFFHNHRFLDIYNMPVWRTIKGGSHCYVEALTSSFKDRIRLSSRVQSIRRFDDGVELHHAGREAERFDQVIIAAHSDQALSMLADPSELEREVLGAISYQENDVVLHTDERLLPRNRRAWASWNYFIPDQPQPRAALTYNMNMLQSLDAPVTFCVTLNRTEDISPGKILQRFRYHHPVFSLDALDAQKRWSEVSGHRRTHYAGAYWGYGFHEDGVKSGLAVCEPFGKKL